jgi:DNA-binding IclR family transcriptional regulator
MAEGSEVPALRRGLAVLRLLASRPGPVAASTVARDLGLPRSSTYHLLAELTKAGFVTHLPEEQRYGLGVAAFEIGSAYLRQDPLERLARPVLRRMVERLGNRPAPADGWQGPAPAAHLGVLHGAETLYLVREYPPQPATLISAVGVRLPAHLPASGRAMLAHLPAAQIRALFPGRDSFVTRTGRGPRDLPALRRLLTEGRRRGWTVEDGHVTAGFASVAAAVFDHGGRPVAAVSATFRHLCPDARECAMTWPELAAEVRSAANELTGRLRGQSPRQPTD